MIMHFTCEYKNNFYTIVNSRSLVDIFERKIYLIDLRDDENAKLFSCSVGTASCLNVKILCIYTFNMPTTTVKTIVQSWY